ncbi:hypothetical protein [Mycolicibacterium insubricum]|uniref:Uncharacterized protein n=1 Tax=Mycolicibacterium insubricum TaxID=444597 RepID=A0A1X0CRL4_9MYCO|nr:hypothetical protein [Mycolicibacterium insubricum]MCV7080133.1 hypothetical protein [Mycolicibacterium insubricum]ORA62807.1 hypothetical protein BST26_20700 [Mycolicibacterium insubricum]
MVATATACAAVAYVPQSVFVAAAPSLADSSADVDGWAAGTGVSAGRVSVTTKAAAPSANAAADSAVGNQFRFNMAGSYL